MMSTQRSEFHPASAPHRQRPRRRYGRPADLV